MIYIETCGENVISSYARSNNGKHQRKTHRNTGNTVVI
nr:MAG TPA: hypothetical protein [Caudoviricetes sp.]